MNANDSNNETRGKSDATTVDRKKGNVNSKEYLSSEQDRTNLNDDISRRGRSKKIGDYSRTSCLSVDALKDHLPVEADLAITIPKFSDIPHTDVEITDGLKEKKASKDAEPTTGPKKKDSTSGSSKGTKSQPKSSGKSVQSEEPVFEVSDSYMPQDQEGNMGDNEDKPRKETSQD
ncbi:hypothetical protein Tco_0269961 [Tanacetum coccineum]